MTKEYYDFNDINELMNTEFEFIIVDGKRHIVAVYKPNGQMWVDDVLYSSNDKLNSDLIKMYINTKYGLNKKGIDLND